MRPQYYTWYGEYRAGNGEPDLAVRRESKSEKGLTAYEKPTLVCTLRNVEVGRRMPAT